MVNPWWAAGLAVPAVILKTAFGGRGSKPKSEDVGLRVDDGTGPSFVCERVCTSDRLMRRMGSLAKVGVHGDCVVPCLLQNSDTVSLPLQEATPNTCVTVCGVSAPDACTDACHKAVCTNMHQVPAWNEACITRCSAECQRGRST